ncbi:MAG: DUF2848 family protein [Pyramidobacter sp.]
MNLLHNSVVLYKNGRSCDLSLEWESCVAAGYTGRDQSSVRKHVEELKKIGVPTPETVPAMYWIEPSRISSDERLCVIGDKTSGEVEVFLASDADNRLYVTVASDHTDRALEAVSVAKAKQICSKVIGSFFWPVDDVKDHWDDIELKLWNDGKLYQEGTLGKMLKPEVLLAKAQAEMPTGRLSLFSGTLPVIGGDLKYGSTYVMLLSDPVLKREIRHEYTVVVLPDRN